MASSVDATPASMSRVRVDNRMSPDNVSPGPRLPESCATSTPASTATMPTPASTRGRTGVDPPPPSPLPFQRRIASTTPANAALATSTGSTQTRPVRPLPLGV